MRYDKIKTITKIMLSPARTKWEKGVKQYALELANKVEVEEYLSEEEFRKGLLNGARDWKQYSYGGCALISDDEIFCRLFTKSAFKEKVKEGVFCALDHQARALKEACDLVMKLAKRSKQ